MRNTSKFILKKIALYLYRKIQSHLFCSCRILVTFLGVRRYVGEIKLLKAQYMMLDPLYVLCCTSCRFQLLLCVLELIPPAAYCLAYISASKILEVTFNFIPHYYPELHLR